MKKDHSLTSVEVFNQCATAYAEKFMNFDLYQDTIDMFCASLSEYQTEILELACGPGNITKQLLQRIPTIKVLATDLSENMLKLTKEYNPSVSVQKLDCRNIASLLKSFDAIICGFGLPYLSKEEAIQFIQDTSKTLNQNGLLYLSTMEDDYSKSSWNTSSNGQWKMFIHYHEFDYLSNALLSNGFEILHVIRKNYPEADGRFTTDLILIARLSWN